jgi:hypothetical protein
MAVYRLPLGYAEWPDPDEHEHEHELRVFEPPADVVERDASARLLVRLPATLRRKIEDSAALEGVPSEVWVSRALARSVDPRLESS